MLARQGRRVQAQKVFYRALAANPDDVSVLLWLAALAQHPQQSIDYINRALEISPRHPQAQEGLRWARARLAGRRRPAKRAPGVVWLDTVLLSGIIIVALVACAILTVIAWQTPEAVQAAYQATATLSPPLSPTPTLIPTFTSMPTFTPTPTFVPTTTPTATPAPTSTATRVVPGEPSMTTSLGTKWIDIQLSTQTLTAYEGDTAVHSALVSTGIPGLPTPRGEYTILLKVRSQTMSGVGYRLPNVEFVSYFYKGYAIHGTYWHNNFGQPMSHGCVNMTNADAQWIFEWAPVGTRVRVRD